jgi:hypothetical protein
MSMLLKSHIFGGTGFMSVLLKSQSVCPHFWAKISVLLSMIDLAQKRTVFSVLSLFWKRKRKLMRLPCCLYVCVSSPGIARLWLGHHFPTATHTDATAFCVTIVVLRTQYAVKV